ncbi:phosphatidylglycerol lysyltransferase domain-containing protein [Frigidibacter sp. MR17.24]|uniref:phosphatidylglycerol lysyltransferase domain-containing protein n=1 Tax=Frigidibacter sp. MR17.24 TaxID=3127345 RepID=UPI003012C5B5
MTDPTPILPRQGGRKPAPPASAEEAQMDAAAEAEAAHRAPGRPIRARLAELPERLADLAAPAIEAAVALRPFAPVLLAAMVFLGGLDLLLQGTGAESFWRKAILRDTLPLPFAEASHLFASLTGLALIVLARGLALRMAKARIVATAVLLAGAGFALMKGLRWEAALVLAAIALGLTLARGAFYRKGEWRDFRPSRGWVLAIVLIVVAVILLGITGFHNHAFVTEDFWTFAWAGDAPRSLRASLALAVATAAIALDGLVNRPAPTRPRAHPVPPAVRRLVAASPDSARQVALLGDKRFLVAEDESAFLMYGISGRSWVCLGGPVGDEAAGERLMWRFVEMADRARMRPVFYSLPFARIEKLLELGHSILKIGEVARIDLPAFAMEGPARKDLRYARKRAERDGLSFEVVPAAQVPALIEALRPVSDAWLAERTGKEKGFSLGAFDAQYLAHFDMAVMRQEGRIVAFANLWASGEGNEMAVDLMRHVGGASPVLMEAFMCEAILHAKARGFRWFSLGGAPLSGLPDHPLAPVWARIGTLVYRRGDEFYSFDGLRRYKQKFGPVWSPFYMTCPGGLSAARALVDVALLISRPRRAATEPEPGPEATPLDPPADPPAAPPADPDRGAAATPA